jgi:hypothetical protein
MLLEAHTVLAAHDVTVERGGLPVLRGVSISVRAGEAVRCSACYLTGGAP